MHGRIGAVLSLVGLLALAACAQQGPPPPPAPGPAPYPGPPPGPAARPAPMRLSDRQFVREAAAGGTAEVEFARLALRKSAAPDVRRFAQEMVADHTRLGNQLTALARRLRMVPPAGLGPERQGERRELAAARGPGFNRRYIDGQIRAHEATIALFEGEARQGRSPQLRRFAQSALPLLQAHLRRAQAIARRVG